MNRIHLGRNRYSTSMTEYQKPAPPLSNVMRLNAIMEPADPLHSGQGEGSPQQPLQDDNRYVMKIKKLEDERDNLLTKPSHQVSTLGYK